MKVNVTLTLGCSLGNHTLPILPQDYALLSSPSHQLQQFKNSEKTA